MGRALAAAFPICRDTFDEADRVFGEADRATGGAGPAFTAADRAAADSLSRLCFEGPEERLTLTENAQPAILTVSTAACRLLASKGIEPRFVAGHSLGEYSANVAAGTFAFADAVRVVRRRGRYMQEAVPVGSGAMTAILGLDAARVAEACRDALQDDAALPHDVVSPANMNGAGQVVIAGSAAAVARAGERAKALGAKRVVPLPVSAPFHCALMKPAEERLGPELRALTARDPRIPIVANVDAAPKRTATDAIEALVAQVVSPVRWESVVQRLASEGVTTYVEVGPGTVLSGLVRKIHRDATVVSFSVPEHLAAVEAATGMTHV